MSEKLITKNELDYCVHCVWLDYCVHCGCPKDVCCEKLLEATEKESEK